MNIRPGLTSVTFRKLTADEIIALVAKSGLAGIEWGGDIHVPHGNVALAREVGANTRDAGLHVSSYGSYYRLVSEKDTCGFQAVLDSAAALGAPVIRVWAGDRGPANADDAYFAAVVEASRNCAEAAAAAGIKLAYEYHARTLTETADATLRLLEAVAHPNIYTYWQPAAICPADEHPRSLLQVRRYLSYLHVYHWENGVRLPLAAGAARWREFFALAAEKGGPDTWALLEFVKDDSPDAFMADARTLLELAGR